MFADLLRRLGAPKPEPITEGDARLALCALLVRLARSDGDYAQAERAKIAETLAARYGLDPSGVDALIHEAEAVEAEAPDTVRFTRAIKESVAYEDRIVVIEALWAIALADGQRSADEDALLRMVAPMLGINDRDSALARQRVAKL
ncbi:TerB family tellurite resistance protein [Rhodobacterales bacterium HKCCA1065]|nr:TerB family tellurite resistance protein [Rhodobacterales bacterium HKCCA1065]